MHTFSGDSASVDFMSAYSRFPIGQAVFAAVNEGIFELIKHVGNRSPEGSIVKANTDQIYTNLGKDMVSIGDLLQVVRGGDELFDPETGISLGGSVTPVGVIEITYAEDKFSVARPVSLSGPVDRGDRVVATKSTEPLEFAKKWKKPK